MALFRRKVTNAQPTAPLPAIGDAVAHHQAGRLAEAETIYQQVLTVEPDHADALHLLGVVSIQRGEAQEAIDLISRSLGVNPENAFALSDLGEAYRAINLLEDATICFERAMKLKPDFFQAQNNLGNVYQAQGQNESAVACYQKALAIKPDYAEAHVNLGNIFQQLGNWDAAIECYQRALATRPDLAEASFNLGNVFKVTQRQEEAIPFYRQAISLKPDFIPAHLALARTLYEVGSRGEAIACFRRACNLDPEDSEARWGLVMTELALVEDGQESAENYRAAFVRGLDELDAWFKASPPGDGFRAIGTQQPFYLAYHEQNNRDLLARFGAMCGRLARQWQDEQGLVVRNPTRGSRIRVGIVSAHIRDHSVWNAITKGWFQHLDQRRFELHAFSIGPRQDEDTDFAKSRAMRFVQGHTTPRQWADAILSEPLDVLIYPEIGMDPMTAKLACLRLAPVQVTTWGHPETSGLPTIDYYLSAAEFEPGGAESNYTEKLVPLANLGCCYEALDVPNEEINLSKIGVDTSIPVLICPGAPFKYAPEHDRIFVEVAQELGRCQFLFFKHPREMLSAQLMQRFKARFSQVRMNYRDFVVEVPWLSRAQFHSLMRQADLYVDTIGFSGFNSAMQAIECGLPVVSREGLFMRGRFASGILRRLGVTELIAASDQEYVDLIIRLARDREVRLSLMDRIRNSRRELFNDVEPVRALESFLANVAATSV